MRYLSVGLNLICRSPTPTDAAKRLLAHRRLTDYFHTAPNTSIVSRTRYTAEVICSLSRLKAILIPISAELRWVSSSAGYGFDTDSLVIPMPLSLLKCVAIRVPPRGGVSNALLLD